MYDEFFAYARERQSILNKKNAGLPRPWTDDRVLDHSKFCNVFREDDRTTIWFKENVRQKVRGPDLLLATVVFRWFNRISTGEAIFLPEAATGRSAWEEYRESGDLEILREAIVDYCGSGPYVTGAYCIIGMPHMSKLDGILACIEKFTVDTSPSSIVPGVNNLWYGDLAKWIWDHPGEVTLEQVWDWLRYFPRSGDFMAYEVVTDLNHTRGMLDGAPDRYTWANAGPGAIRGLNRIHERFIDHTPFRKAVTNLEMFNILEASRLPNLWPQIIGENQLKTEKEVFVDPATPASHQWPAWDMRTVEHTLCEFDKYNRVHEGGKVKGVYR